MYNFLFTLLIGLIFNMPIIVFLSMAYDKVDSSEVSKDFSRCLLPLIILTFVILGVAFAAFLVLLVDLLFKGCLTWHRDSLGVIFQKMIFIICLCIFTLRMHNYLKYLEAGESVKVLYCFGPLNVLSALMIIKLMFL